MKKRPEGQILIVPDPVEFRCPNCNPNGWNRTGRIQPVPEETDTPSMWGKICIYCNDGWMELG